MFKYFKNNILNGKVFGLSRSTITGSMANEEIVEAVLCKESDLTENSMKEFPLGAEDQKVLLYKQEGCIYATGTKCTHYGAPLATGDLGNGKVRCPWHGALFDIKTGDIEDSPGLDSLPVYKVCIEKNGDVKVSGKKSDLKANKRIERYVKDHKTDETFVIIGAGGAGSSCAETLRKKGFNGKLLLISKDKYLPYDRPKISKQMDAPISKVALRDESFYKAYEIEILTGETVSKVDTTKKMVITESCKEFNYSKLFIACGLLANPPNFIPGNELQNIFTIRTLEDSERVTAALKPDSKVVILGTSFIGMEAASYLKDKVARVTVVGRDDAPFKPILGAEIGSSIQKLFESKGINFMNNAKIEKFVGENNKLTGVVVDGTTVPADICISGLGTVFDTKFLKGSGIQVTDRGAIEVDEYLQTTNPNVFAGGDVASAPIHGSKQKGSIGHWQLAQYHGRTAAHNMLGFKKSIKSVPFFYSSLFGKGLRYAGYGKFDDVVFVGDIPNLKFVAYYCNGPDVVAAASIQFDPVVAKVANFMYEGKKLTKQDVQENKWLKG